MSKTIDQQYNQIVKQEFETNKNFVNYALNFSSEKSNIHEGFLPTALKPRFIFPQDEALIKNSTELIIKCLGKMEVALRHGDKKLQNTMGITGDEMEVMKYPVKYKATLPFIRIDGSLFGDQFKIMEINLNYPGGPGIIDELEEKFSKLSSMEQMVRAKKIKAYSGLKERLLETLLNCYGESDGKSEKPNIMILRWSDYDWTVDTDNLASYFNSKGYPTKIFDPREVQYVDGKLMKDGFGSDLILRWVDLDLFLERKKECACVIEAAEEGKAVIMNPFSSGLMAAKSAFAVMTSAEFDYLFDEEELGELKKYIPWTRIFDDIDSDLPDGGVGNMKAYALRNKDSFVLKPAFGTFGKDVHVGKDITQEEWQAVVEKALGQRYILQERITLPKENFPAIRDGKLIFEERRIDIDPFLFEGKFFCTTSRCAYGHIMNAYQGGIVALNYLVEE